MSGQQSTLSDAHLKLFLAILFRNEQVFESFRSSLTAGHFDFVGYQLLYKVVWDYFNENNCLPELSQINADVASYIEKGFLELDTEEYDELDDFLYYAFDPDLFKDQEGPKSSKSESFAFKFATKFLLEQQKKLAIAKLRDLDDIGQLPTIFEQASAQTESLMGLSISGGRNLTLPDGWDQRANVSLTSCGIGFLDTFLDSGTAPGEAYAILAPFGSYKTTLAVMLWYAAAKQAFARFLSGESNGKKGLAILVSYEAPLQNEIRDRLLMYSAQISRTRLQVMGTNGVSIFGTDPEQPNDYEKVLFKEQIANGVFEPEMQRYQRVLPIVNEHTVCLDFTGRHEKFKTAGNRGVPEIASAIKTELKRCGPDYFVATVILDYVGLMVQRDVTVDPKQRQREDVLYQLAGLNLVNRIAMPFSTPVWAFHQLSGEANAILNPAKRMDHTQAKGSKSFGENFAFCFAGSRLNDDYMGQLTCSKQRRAGKHNPVLLKVDGLFNTVTSPEGYTIDRLGRIVRKESIADSQIVAPPIDGFIPSIEENTEADGSDVDDEFDFNNSYDEANETQEQT
jgi:hypothetical protein